MKKRIILLFGFVCLMFSITSCLSNDDTYLPETTFQNGIAVGKGDNDTIPNNDINSVNAAGKDTGGETGQTPVKP